MKTPSRENTKLVAVALGAALLCTAGPATAANVVKYAQAAGKVDGKDAVSSTADPAARAGKLVAADARGMFPAAMIAGAVQNAARLGGVPAAAYALDSDLDGFVTEAEAESFVTENDLGEYLTADDLTGYVKGSDLDSKLGNYAKLADLAGYVSLAEFKADRENRLLSPGDRFVSNETGQWVLASKGVDETDTALFSRFTVGANGGQQLKASRAVTTPALLGGHTVKLVSVEVCGTATSLADIKVTLSRAVHNDAGVSSSTALGNASAKNGDFCATVTPSPSPTVADTTVFAVDVAGAVDANSDSLKLGRVSASWELVN